MLFYGACGYAIGRYNNTKTFTKPAEVSDDSVGSVAPVVGPRPQLVIAGVAEAPGGHGTRGVLPDAAACLYAAHDNNIHGMMMSVTIDVYYDSMQ